jgi:hypothetical protein
MGLENSAAIGLSFAGLCGCVLGGVLAWLVLRPQRLIWEGFWRNNASWSKAARASNPRWS